MTAAGTDQQSFGDVGGSFDVCWYGFGQAGEAAVKKWRSDFQSAGHADFIHSGEVVISHAIARFHVHAAVERLPACWSR